MWLLKLIKTNH